MRGNVIRENDKSNFLASFKKVILLPVSVLPTLPFPGTHSHFRSSTQIGKVSTPNQSSTPARPSTPSGWEDTPTPPNSLPNNAQPATELAAQTEILNSRLERIKTLFSIEVALKLIHMGKETLERMKSFRRFRGEVAEKVYVHPLIPLTLADKVVKLHLSLYWLLLDKIIFNRGSSRHWNIYQNRKRTRKWRGMKRLGHFSRFSS